MMNVAWAHDGIASGARDARLPQLAWFAESDRVLQGLRRAFRLDADSCKVFNVWYIPTKSLRVVYQLEGQSLDRASSLVALDFQPVGKDHVVASPGVLALADWNAVAWRMPDDPELQSARAVFSRADSGWSVLSYLPRKRCVFRRPSGPGLVLGKLEPAAAVHANHDTLSRLWHAPDREFRMPAPLFVDTNLAVRWEEYVEGSRFESAELASVRSVIDAVVGLHATRLDGLRVLDAPRVLAQLELKVMPRIEAAMPDLVPLATAISAGLRSRLADLPLRPAVTLHADLHTANVLLDAEGAILVDLDSVARGDPAFDLALLGTRMLLQSLVSGSHVELVAESVAALPDLYAARSGRAIPERTFAWYVAALLLSRQVKTCIRHHAPGLDRLARTLVEWSADILTQQRFEPGVCRI